MANLILHEYSASGNCYKIRLTAAHLGLELERREYDIMQGETRSDAFLTSVNANGRIPVLQVGDDFLPESSAACFYLADGSALIPADRFDRADMLRWMFWEQYNHEPNIATLRFWMRWLGPENLTEVQRLQTVLPVRTAAAASAAVDASPGPAGASGSSSSSSPISRFGAGAPSVSIPTPKVDVSGRLDVRGTAEG